MVHSFFFEENLSLLRRRFPEVAWRLEETASGELPLALAEDPQQWASTLKLDAVDLLYVYGVGEGGYYGAVREWLDAHPHRHLVFLEHDQKRLKRWLGCSTFREALQHLRVHLYLFDPQDHNDPLYERLYSFFSLLRAEFAAHEAYVAGDTQRCSQLRLRLLQESASCYRLSSEFMTHSEAYYQNFYKNLLQLPNAYLGNHLFGRFEGVPAIICGAGPSLQRNVHLLRDLAHRALIFAGGSSLNGVSSAGIAPHFGAGVDPHYPQFQRIMTNQAFEVPIFYRNRWYHEALDVSQGPKLYLTGAGGQEVASWCDEQLGIEGEVAT